jgi:uncharacterized protein with HEPN domain
MSLVIIGEVATKIMDRYPGFVDGQPSIPWRNIRGMRNRIAHGYFDINLESSVGHSANCTTRFAWTAERADTPSLSD